MLRKLTIFQPCRGSFKFLLSLPPICHPYRGAYMGGSASDALRAAVVKVQGLFRFFEKNRS